MLGTQPILLVEDDQIDQKSTLKAFKDLKIPNPLMIANNGMVALEKLNDEKAQLPSLILLDLNMPRMNGIEFLQEVKSSERLKRIPVVVLTTSQNDNDKAKCYDLSVAGYMTKPVDYREFVELLGTIDRYWSTSQFVSTL